MMNEAKAKQIKQLAEDIDNILDKLDTEAFAYAVYRESVIFSDYYYPEFYDDEKITDIPRVRHMVEDLRVTWKALIAKCDFNRKAAVKAVKAVDVDMKELRKYLEYLD